MSRPKWLALVLTLLLFTSLAPVAQSQVSVTNKQVSEVAHQLTCPLCADRQPLDQCTLRACEQLKQQIAEQLAAGETIEDILANFVEMYGPQVLLSYDTASTSDETDVLSNTTLAATQAATSTSNFDVIEYLLVAIVVLLGILVFMGIVLLRRHVRTEG